MKTRVIIADDHPVVIQGIKELLEKSEQFEIIQTFNDGKALLQSPMLVQADVLLLDLNMPKVDGLQVLDELKKMQLVHKAIVVTSYMSHQLTERCKAMGVGGYIVKSEELDDLANCIRQVVAGEAVFPDFSQPSSQSEDDFSYFDGFLKKHKLTKREVEIIRLVCSDMNSKDVADKLCLSTFTVQTHRRNIIKKLGLEDSKIALYRFAIENALI